MVKTLTLVLGYDWSISIQIVNFEFFQKFPKTHCQAKRDEKVEPHVVDEDSPPPHLRLPGKILKILYQGKKGSRINFTKINKISIMVEKTIISFENGQWRIHSFFGQIGTHTEPCWHQVERLSKFVPPDTLEMHSVALPVLRFCKTFSKILRLTLQKLFFVDDFLKIHIFKQKICMATSLWELQSYLSLIDAASTTKRITRISGNYLR